MLSGAKRGSRGRHVEKGGQVDFAEVGRAGAERPGLVSLVVRRVLSLVRARLCISALKSGLVRAMCRPPSLAESNVRHGV